MISSSFPFWTWSLLLLLSLLDVLVSGWKYLKTTAAIMGSFGICAWVVTRSRKIMVRKWSKEMMMMIGVLGMGKGCGRVSFCGISKMGVFCVLWSSLFLVFLIAIMAPMIDVVDKDEQNGVGRLLMYSAQSVWRERECRGENKYVEKLLFFVGSLIVFGFFLWSVDNVCRN